MRSNGKEKTICASVRQGGVLFLISFIAALTVSADTLSIKRYVEIVLKNNPQPKIAASAVDADKAARTGVIARFLPHVQASAGVNGGHTYSNTSAVQNSSSASANGVLNSGVDAQALLFDFGKTPLQLQASTASVNAATHDLQGTIQSTIVDARTAYYNNLLSHAVADATREALKQAQAHYDEAQTLFQVGKQAQIAVTKARVDLANAQVKVIQAQNQQNLALVQLEKTAGVTLDKPVIPTDSLDEPEDSIGMQEALELSYEKRPEILSAKAATLAAQLQYAASKRAYFPAVNASAGYDWRKDIDRDDRSNGWSLGASLSMPIYQGGATYASTIQAKAALERSQASQQAAILNVTQEVQQFYFRQTEARQRIEAARMLIDQSAEGLRLSQERFRAGIATFIEITDAEITLLNARITFAQALFDYRVAHANLLQAIGALAQ